MCSLERFKIDLKGLIEETTVLDFDLDDQFFAALDGSEVRQGTLHASVSIRKATGFFELQFHIEGTVTVACDRCLDDMDQPIAADNRFIVKIGTAYSEEDDVITVSDGEDSGCRRLEGKAILDTSWLIYETIVLAIPIKHVHAPGKCNPAMSKVLEELSADRSSDVASDQPVDPRWSALLKLKDK